MEPDLKLWTERQDIALEKMVAKEQRQTDSLALIGHQLETIIELLTPAQPTDEATSLEILLATLVAQGKEILSVLKEQSGAIMRIERGLPDDARPKPANGTGRGAAA